MKVVILCGGKGNRLREETEYRPKPMVPIGDRPILWHIMKIYATHGYNEFILCLGYKGDMIKDFFRNYHWMTSDVTLSLGQRASAKFHNHHTEEDWRVTLADTGQETMTGGRINRIRHYLGQDTEFFLTYGDCVGNIDIKAALQFHREHGKKLPLTAVRPPGRFGELAVDGQSRVTQFNEKPQAAEGRINGGFFVASTGFSTSCATATARCSSRNRCWPWPRRSLMAWQHNAFWQPMDTFQEFTLLNKMWAEGKAPWKTW